MIRRPRRLLLSLLGLASLTVAPPSLAADEAPTPGTESLTVERGAHRVVLPPLGRLCRLDVDHPIDDQLLTALRNANGGQNSVLALYADCTQLGQLRETGRGQVQDSAMILIPGAVVGDRLALERPAMVASIARELSSERAFDWDGMLSAERFALSAVIDNTTTLGILRQTDDYVLTGSRQAVRVPGAEVQRDEVTVTGLTKAGTALVSVHLTADVHGRDAEKVYQANLATLETYMQALVAANPDPALEQ